MAREASVPVINGLTDYSHPCQAMADFLTVREVKGRTEGIKLAFVGDGNNVAHSLMFAGALLGAHVSIVTPAGYEPKADALAWFNAVNGSQPLHYPCSSPPAIACDRYIWTSASDQKLYTEMEVVYGQIGEIDAYVPRFTLGEMLIMLRGLHIQLDGAYPGFEANHQFYVQLAFADSRLMLNAIASCSGTYLDLMQTPITDVIVESPILRARSIPMTSFGALRRAFEQICGPE